MNVLKPRSHCLFAIVAFLAVFFIQTGAIAQGSFSIFMHAPDLAQFPKITLYVDAFDAQGKFIPTLDLDSFKVFEDGFERTLNETSLLEPGLHTIFAFNLGPTLSNRKDSTVPTRYEETIFAVASWITENKSTAPNQYSLVSNEGALADSVQERDTFTYRIQNYKPNLFNFQPDLASLSMALEIASRPTLDPLGKRAIVLVTPLPLDQSLSSLAVIRARAIELRVPINVWLVAPETAANAPAAAQLNELAVSTGGRFLFYPENLQQPDVEEFVGSLRQIYRLRYTSGVSQSGAHQVRVEATYGSQNSATPETQFGINLNMPTAVITGLPDEIQRRYEAGATGRTLQPGFVTVQAEIIFPDGYERQVKATRFYVDGVLTAENKEEPFGVFAWPLSNYQFSGEHLLSVEVEDILGFRNISPPVSVMITVETLYPAWLTATLKYFNSGGWVPLAIAALGLTVFFSLRLRSRRLYALEASGQNETSDLMDPLLQPVVGLDTASDQNLEESISPHPSDFEDQPPCLVCMGGAAEVIGDGRICIDNEEMIIGSDPSASSIYLNAKNISARHARLLRQVSGAVLIADMGSETGTWVNYAPVSSRGLVLNQNDLVQIGNLEFRYQIGQVKRR